jgi:CheY-like chemotaxis protein
LSEEVAAVPNAARRLVVLVVDDDPGDVLLIRDALEAAGRAQAVHVAVDGREAVSFLRRTGVHAAAPRPDVVLLDLNMPGMNGWQVLADIKPDPKLSGIPILVLSTSRDPGDIEAAYALYANAYVPKPNDFDDFTAAVLRIDEFFTQVAALPAAS